MSRTSVLFTPGDRPEMMRKAPDAGAETVVFDLEDAVSPSRKVEARDSVRTVLSDPDFDPDCEVCVRVNATTELAAADLEGILGGSDAAGGDGDLRLDGVMLPKAESAADVDALCESLAAHDVSLPILALIESAGGVLAAAEIAAVPETDALLFGAEDLSADVGATRTPEGLEVLYARQRVVIAAAAHGCDAIDTVFTDFGDEEGLREETEFAVGLGYDGKLAIHPAQIEPITEVFAPTPSELEWAESILAAKREADAEGRGVFEVDGEMIDAPLIAQAERIVARADSRSN